MTNRLLLLESVRLQNFRSFRDETLELDEQMTILIGANDSGKSSLVRALRCLEEERIRPEDCNSEVRVPHSKGKKGLRASVCFVFKLQQVAARELVGGHVALDEANNRRIISHAKKHLRVSWTLARTKRAPDKKDGEWSATCKCGKGEDCLLPSPDELLRRATGELKGWKPTVIALQSEELLWPIEPLPVTSHQRDIPSAWKPILQAADVWSFLGEFMGDKGMATKRRRENAKRNLTKLLGANFEFAPEDGKMGLNVIDLADRSVAPNKQGIGTQIRQMLTVQLSHTSPTASLVLFDEVDTSLHASSQRAVYEELLRFAKESSRQFVVATHSPYMLRKNEPYRIRIVERKDGGDSKISDQSIHHNWRAIREAIGLSYLEFSEPSDTVLVEGESDELYIRALAVLAGRAIGIWQVKSDGSEGRNVADGHALERYGSVERVVALGDGDKTGEQFVNKAKEAGLHALSVRDVAKRLQRLLPAVQSSLRKCTIEWLISCDQLRPVWWDRAKVETALPKPLKEVLSGKRVDMDTLSTVLRKNKVKCAGAFLKAAKTFSEGSKPSSKKLTDPAALQEAVKFSHAVIDTLLSPPSAP